MFFVLRFKGSQGIKNSIINSHLIAALLVVMYETNNACIIACVIVFHYFYLILRTNRYNVSLFNSKRGDTLNMKELLPKKLVERKVERKDNFK